MKFDSVCSEYGAVTIVSAISSFRGVTAGTDLRSTVSVKLEEGRDIVVLIRDMPDMSDALIRECVAVTSRFNKTGRRGLYIETRSEIPPSRGMKSSSSVSVAAVRALLDAYGVRLPTLSILRLAARASIRAGVSVTGAFDDAAACHYGGLVFADNRRMRMERRLSFRRKYRVVYSIPERAIVKGKLPLPELRKWREGMLQAYRMAVLSLYREAALSNSLILSRILSIDPSPLLSSLIEGAAVAGITGTGPALFALCTGREMPGVLRSLSGYGRTVVCRARGVSSNGTLL